MKLTVITRSGRRIVYVGALSRVGTIMRILDSLGEIPRLLKVQR